MYINGFVVYLHMQKQQETDTLLINFMADKIAALELKLVEKDATILEKDISIEKLTTDIESIKFQNEQLRRMIFGSKRERFVSVMNAEQLSIEFEPKATEIAEAIKAERELIRVAYERKKPKKSIMVAWHYHLICLL